MLSSSEKTMFYEKKQNYSKTKNPILSRWGSQRLIVFILRKKQYEKTEEEKLDIAKNIILLKIKNQLNLLKSIRNKPQYIKYNITKIKEIILKINLVNNYESLLGYE